MRTYTSKRYQIVGYETVQLGSEYQSNRGWVLRTYPASGTDIKDYTPAYFVVQTAKFVDCETNTVYFLTEDGRKEVAHLRLVDA